MKAGFGAVALLFVLFYVECRKTYAPIDKNANLAFINMEGGGGAKPAATMKPAAPTPVPVVPAPTNKQPAATNKPAPAPQPITIKPSVVPTPAQPAPAPAKPAQPQPISKITPRPVNPAPAANPITTPGPGSVKQLVNFYDSQGKASPIRPYSYSQAVKQG